MSRIGGEQRVQQCCPASRQADDENGFADFLVPDFGVTLSIAHQKQSIAQNADDIVPERELSDHIQTRFAMTLFQ